MSHTTLRTITASTEIFYDPDPAATVIEDDRDFVEAFFAIPDEEVEANLHRQSPWLLRFELDRAKMLDKKLEMSFVANAIAAVFKQDIFVIWSEDNAEKLIIRCRALNESGAKEDGGEEDDDEDIFLRQLESTMLSTISLRGVEGIERVFMLKHKRNVITESGEFDNPTEWVLETDGINLEKVLCVDGVDATRTYSNSIVEVLEVLGIEAARAAVLRELRNVIEFDGSRVNYRHLSLLCDLMTNRGQFMAITRHGINRADTGPLMRCSFEETVEILMEAAAIGEVDYCTGVAENVLLGQVAPMGTGAFELSLDFEMLHDVVVDHRLPVAAAMQAAMYGGRTPGGVAGGSGTPYNEFESGKTPAYNYNVESNTFASFSPIHQAGGEGYNNGTPSFGGASPYGGASPFAGGASPGYSPAFVSFSLSLSESFADSVCGIVLPLLDTLLLRQLDTILVRREDLVDRLDSLLRLLGLIEQVEDKPRAQDTLPRVLWLLTRPLLLVSLLLFVLIIFLVAKSSLMRSHSHLRSRLRVLRSHLRVPRSPRLVLRFRLRYVFEFQFRDRLLIFFV